MTWYNTSFIDNAAGPVPFFAGVAGETAWFAGAIILFSFLMMLLWFRKAGYQDSFLASSFLMSILSGLMFMLGWLDSWVLTIPVSAFIAALVMKIWGEG